MFTLKIEFLTELIIDYLKLEHQLMDFHCLSPLHTESQTMVDLWMIQVVVVAEPI